MSNPLPPPTRPVAVPVEHPLYYKVLALRGQLGLYEQAIQLAQAQAQLADAERRAMQAGLDSVERELREALQPPADAKFNWQTLTFDPAP